ncbi:uncharacterized protein [Pocillopora verrucosa]|uniref:uncharacterized protein n=1 Tax=Pocillopora verrucosa TaxID=203993 RepID=UPI00333F6AF6
MESPVSAVIANLYMESSEEQAITTSFYQPRIWKRYMDNTFTILDRENKLTKTRKPNNSAKPINDFKATAVLPYVKGLSEQLRCCLQQQGIPTVFKLETMLRFQFVRTKDAVDPAKQYGVVYGIPCECGKVYIRETGRPMQDRIN